MNELELKNIWKGYDRKIDRILAINQQQMHELKAQKAESKIRSFQRNHIFVMLLGIVWVAFLSFLVYHTLDNVYFSISVSVMILFNVFAVGLYFRHILILGQINMSESIAATQQKLAKVYASYTNSSRVLLLQAPFYCTWWYTPELVRNADPVFWTVQFIVVSFFTIASIFLYLKLAPSNPSTKWRKWSSKYFGAQKLENAMSVLEEIEEES